MVKDEKVSYDLVKGAWLPPHGDGETCDIQFVFNENVLGWKEDKGYDGTFVMKLYRTTTAISIPGQGNGIVETPSRENAGIKLLTAISNGTVDTTSVLIQKISASHGHKAMVAWL